MAKILLSGMQTHLSQTVTTLASCWRIQRRDGQNFYFTTHDRDISFGGNTYIHSAGYNTTAIDNNSAMSVDNMDVEGVIDSNEITDADLRNGRFNYAEIWVFFVNWQDPDTDGAIKIRRGWLGEVKITNSGIFKAELRGMTQALTQSIVELYTEECKADLGDSRCKMAIVPDYVTRSTAYAVGDYVRASSNLELAYPLFPFDTDGDDAHGYLTGTLGAQAAISATTYKFGTGSMEFSPSGSVNPSTAYVSLGDIKALGSADFTIEGWVRFKDLTSTRQVFVSQYLNTGNQRSWIFQYNAGALELYGFSDGSTRDLTVTETWAPSIDTWYHVAVTRDGDNFRVFVDGTQLGTDTTSASYVFHDSTADAYFGKRRESGGDDVPLDGFLDDWRLVIGEATRTTNFTAPASAHTVTDMAQTLITEDYDNRIYECTTAGTTQEWPQPAYDSTVTNTTTDGTAVFTAVEAWTRSGVVATVTNNKTFTVTLTESRAVDDWFNYGVLHWDTGDNQGMAMEVRDWVNSTATVTLFLPMNYDVQVGDKFSINAGCDKKGTTCKVKFDNYINFRGFPHIPRQDDVFSIAGAAGETSGGGSKGGALAGLVGNIIGK